MAYNIDHQLETKLMFDNILLSYGLDPRNYRIEQLGTGLINCTYKLCGSEDYILQQVNCNVFKCPEDIARNISVLGAHLKRARPDYLFIAPLPNASGDFLVKSGSGDYFRLFPFIKGAQTITFVSSEKEAFEAARQFGRFTCLLKDVEIEKLKYTLTDFHNLPLRFEQFKTAYQNASKERLDQ